MRQGRERTAFLFALWAMAGKLALAAAAGLSLTGIEVAGFDPGQPTESGRWAVLVIYALIPIVLKGVAIDLIWRFPLTARKHQVVRRLEAA